MTYQTLLKHHKPILFFSLMTAMFLCIWANTTFTPLMMDDYLYCFVFGAEDLVRVDGFDDIYNSMVSHYFTWGGRVTVHTVVQLFLWIGKWLYNILNAVVYVLLSYMLYRFAGTQKFDFKYYALVLVAMWFYIPIFGETVFWVSGSINYLWSAAFNLFWLFQFKKQLDAPHKAARWFPVLFCIGSFFVGSISENLSFACIFIATLFVIQMKILKQTVARWMYVALGSGFAGWLFLIVAPGNYLRADSISSESANLWTYYDRFTYLTAGLAAESFVILGVFIALFILAIYQKVAPRVLCTSLIVLLGAMASHYALIVTPTFYLRTMVGVHVLILAACAVLYTHITFPAYQIFTTIAITISFLYFGFSVIEVTDVLLRKSIESNQRDAYVIACAEEGIMDVVVDKIYADIDYSVFYTSISDLESYAGFYANTHYAAYYGIDSIIANP